MSVIFFFFQAEDGIRYSSVTGVQTCALPILEHLAATPVGVEVKAVATFLGMEGKRYRFKVRAFDLGGLVGQGEHTRASVDRERLERGAYDGNERGPGWAFPLSAPAPSLAHPPFAAPRFPHRPEVPGGGGARPPGGADRRGPGGAGPARGGLAPPRRAQRWPRAAHAAARGPRVVRPQPRAPPSRRARAPAEDRGAGGPPPHPRPGPGRARRLPPGGEDRAAGPAPRPPGPGPLLGRPAERPRLRRLPPGGRDHPRAPHPPGDPAHHRVGVLHRPRAHDRARPEDGPRARLPRGWNGGRTHRPAEPGGPPALRAERDPGAAAGALEAARTDRRRPRLQLHHPGPLPPGRRRRGPADRRPRGPGFVAPEARGRGAAAR